MALVNHHVETRLDDQNHPENSQLQMLKWEDCIFTYMKIP